MKTIFKYKSLAEYNAASNRPASAPSISLARDAPMADKVNAITDTSAPEVGDHVFWDRLEGRRVLVKYGTLNLSAIDTDRYVDLQEIYVGTRYGKRITMNIGRLAAKKFATDDEWLVSGLDLSKAGSFTLTAHSGDGSSASYRKVIAVAWAAGAAMSSVVSQITGITYSSALAVGDTSFAILLGGWSAATKVEISDGIGGGANVTASREYQGYQYKYYGDAYTTLTEQENGVKGANNLPWNHDKTYDYYSINGADTAASIDDPLLKKSAFNATDNPDLYNAFDGNYEAYFEENFRRRKVKSPSWRPGTVNGDQKFLFGGDETVKLAAVTHTRIDGITVHDFPMHYDATLVGVSVPGAVTGYEPGTGHVGGFAEYDCVISVANRAQNDAISLSLLEAGGTRSLYDTTYWLAFQRHANFGWIFYGTYGYLRNGNRVNANYARVFHAFDINDF